MATWLLFECKSIALYNSIGHLLCLDLSLNPSIPDSYLSDYAPEVPFNDYQQRGSFIISLQKPSVYPDQRRHGGPGPPIQYIWSRSCRRFSSLRGRSWA